VALNPNDAEEALWCFAAEARLTDIASARQAMLVVGVDRRPHVQKCLDAFRIGAPGAMHALLATSGSPEVIFYVHVRASLGAPAHPPRARAPMADVSRAVRRGGLRAGRLDAVHRRQGAFAPGACKSLVRAPPPHTRTHARTHSAAKVTHHPQPTCSARVSHDYMVPVVKVWAMLRGGGDARDEM